MNRGFVVMAQNTESTDYVKCAELLAISIKNTMPMESVSIITNDHCDWSLFDHVIELPYGDIAKNSNWKLENDWQVYDASPYEYTIKIEADVFIPRRIDHWWDVLKNRDLNITTTVRDHKNNISMEKMYRQIFVRNKLPDTYNAITYFRKSDTAKEFYALVKDIFENWKDYRALLNYCPDDIPTTDVVYAIAASIIGEHKCTLPKFTDMSMIHMKQAIINSVTSRWYEEFVYEIHQDVIRINTVPQMFPFHYHDKKFSDVILKELGYEY